MRFRFIEDHRADYPVRIMCGALDVSPVRPVPRGVSTAIGMQRSSTRPR